MDDNPLGQQGVSGSLENTLVLHFFPFDVRAELCCDPLPRGADHQPEDVKMKQENHLESKLKGHCVVKCDL